MSTLHSVRFTLPLGIILAAGLILGITQPASAQLQTEEEAFEPHLQPSISINGGISGRSEVIGGDKQVGAAAGASFGLDYYFMPKVAWANRVDIGVGFLPTVEFAELAVRTGIRWEFIEWAYLGANLFCDFYPDISPGAEAVVGLQYRVGSATLYAEVSTPVRFLESQPFDVVVEGGVRLTF